MLIMQSMSAQQSNFSVEARLDTSVIKIGEQTTFRLQVNFIKGSKFNAPIFQDTITSEIEIIEQLKPDTIENNNGTWTHEYKYRLTSFDSGYHVIPPILFKTNKDSLFTEAVLLEVQTMAVDTTKAFKPIKGIKDEPLKLSDVLPWIVAALLLILIIGFIIVILLKRKGKAVLPVAAPKPALPPYEEAINRLEELKNQKLWQKDQIKKYYIELSAIVRHYIERRYGVDSEELTSRETLEQIQSRVSAQAYSHLKQLLEQSDLVKFARMKPMPDENDMSFRHAVAFVEQSKPQETESEEKENNNDVE